jgi:hypothetical protein
MSIALSIERRCTTEMARVRYPAEASLASESEVALDKCCVAQVVSRLWLEIPDRVPLCVKCCVCRKC